MTAESGKTIAKNTLILYLRTILMLFITLYTSRVILDALGVDNYGIYNVVAGLVTMFSMISAPMTLVIGRFITYELGCGNEDRLQRVFSMSVNIQIILIVLLVLLGETFGIYFLNHRLSIPDERLSAAFWVLQFAMAEMALNLLNVPYNAAIISHERMSAFAYISIVEAVLNLLVAFLIYRSPWDSLVVYSMLLVVVSLFLRIIYMTYCHRHFIETHYRIVFDRSLLKEMGDYAGWNFISNAVVVFNNQGVTILFNIFFGVTANAARGLAARVESAVTRFAANFTTAMNPQIIKSYAAGDVATTQKLVSKGTKFTYFLMLLFSLPIIYETEEVLSIWLVEVPPHTATFIRLALVGTYVSVIGQTSSTAIHATGKIRMYTVIVTLIISSVFPATLVAFKYGAPVETSYYFFILFYAFAFMARLGILKQLIDFPLAAFLKDFVARVITVTLTAQVVPLSIICLAGQGMPRLIVNTVATVCSTLIVIYVFGLTKEERDMVLGFIKGKWTARC